MVSGCRREFGIDEWGCKRRLGGIEAASQSQDVTQLPPHLRLGILRFPTLSEGEFPLFLPRRVEDILGHGRKERDRVPLFDGLSELSPELREPRIGKAFVNRQELALGPRRLNHLVPRRASIGWYSGPGYGRDNACGRLGFVLHCNRLNLSRCRGLSRRRRRGMSSFRSRLFRVLVDRLSERLLLLGHAP